jgi:hypothetical protein
VGGELPDCRGEVDGPEADQKRTEELGGDDERRILALEVTIEAEVEWDGRVVQHQRPHY